MVKVTSDFVSINGFTIQNSGDYPSSLISLNSYGNNVTRNILRASGDRGIEVNFMNNIISENDIRYTFYGILLLSSSFNNITLNYVSNAEYGTRSLQHSPRIRLYIRGAIEKITTNL